MSGVIAQVFLLSDRIRFRNKLAELLVQVLRLFQLEVMDVVVPGDRVDALKEWLFMPVREHQMTDNS
jgi:hypothetical protein